MFLKILHPKRWLYILLGALALRVLSQGFWDKIPGDMFSFALERIYFAGVLIMEGVFIYFVLKLIPETDLEYKCIKLAFGLFFGMACFALMKTLFMNIWHTPPNEYWGGLAGLLITTYQIVRNVRIKRRKVRDTKNG